MGHVDLAIVGGGVAGTYVAYRMGQQHPEWTIALFERSQRVGGRLLSLWARGIDGVRAELGGMRFRTSQPKITALVAELGLAARPFRTVDDDNFYLLRGRRLRAAGFRRGESLTYGLEPTFHGMPPAEVLFAAIEAVIPGAQSMSPGDWAAAKPTLAYRGRALSDWSIDDLLDTVVGREGRAFIADGFGYDAIFGDRNAADCIPWLLIEARPETENYTLVDGMESLPRTLAARFTAAGGTIRSGSRLVRLRRHGTGANGSFELSFAGGRVERAQRVVVAVPRRALEDIDGVLVDEALRDLARSVGIRTAAKLALWYETPWWRERLGNGLRAVTEPPLQKVYLFDRAAPPQSGGALLLVYTDGSARQYWAELAGVDPARTDNLPLASPDRWAAYRPPRSLVEAATRHLRELFDVPPPEPRAAGFKDWGGPTEHGAYNVWLVGRPSWAVIPRMVQPLAEVPLYVCGESYADSQGWIEGALETSDVVVERLSAKTDSRPRRSR